MKYETYEHDTDHIARAIGMMENGPYGSTTNYKKFKRDLIRKGYFVIDKIYRIEEQNYCWLIWKSVDISKDPECPWVLKIVPKMTLRSEKEIKQVLELQGWTYL